MVATRTPPLCTRALDRVLKLPRKAATKQRYRTTESNFGNLGPAFLIYYSPAFLRTVAKTNPLAALQILAVIYRSARELFPFSRRAIASKLESKEIASEKSTAALSPPPLIARLSEGIVDSGRVNLTGATGTVTVRIDQIKDLDTDKLLEAHQAGDKWYIARCNQLEAVVVRHNPTMQPVLPAELDESLHNFREMDVVGALLPQPVSPEGINPAMVA